MRRYIRSVTVFVRRNPARARAFALAVMVLVASFLPALPVDLIDAVIVAALGLGATETVQAKARKRVREAG